MMSLLSQVQAVERTAGGDGAIDWPIDDLAAELMYNRADAAGPFKEYDDEIDAALAASFRYQYTVKPGRPLEYVAGRMFPAIETQGSACMWVLANGIDESGYPFSKVENAAGATAGDKVGVRIPTSFGEFAEYNNVLVLDTRMWPGNGPEFDLADFEHVNNGGFATSADYWYLETLGDPGSWVWAAGVVQTAGGATSGAFWQLSTNLLRPFVKGMTYRVRFAVFARTAGEVTPYIGSAAGTAVSAAGTYYTQHITVVDDDAELLFKGGAFDGALGTISVHPVYNEHINDGAFRFDPANETSWTLGAGWTWIVGPPRSMLANPETSSLTQPVAKQAIPFENGQVYDVIVRTASATGGTIKPRIGIGEGHDVTPSGTPENHTWQVTADDHNSTVPLDFELVATGFTGIVYCISVCKNEPDPNGDLEVILEQSE